MKKMLKQVLSHSKHSYALLSFDKKGIDKSAIDTCKIGECNSSFTALTGLKKGDTLKKLDLKFKKAFSKEVSIRDLLDNLAKDNIIRDRVFINRTGYSYELTVYDENNFFIIIDFDDIVAGEKDTVINRLNYETALSKISTLLLSSRKTDEIINQMLYYLHEPTDAKRVYIFRNIEDESAGICMSQVYEYCADGVDKQIDNEELEKIPYMPAFERWYEKLSCNHPVYGEISTFPEGERVVLESQGIISILIIPIFVADKFYGFIGFDETEKQKIWSENDVKLLQTVAGIFGSFIEKREMEETLRISRERYALSIDGSSDGIWDWDLTDNSLFLSERWKAMIGYEDSEFPNSFEAFKGSVHPDDWSIIMDYVEKYFKREVREYSARFRMFHKDGSIRWIKARGKALFDDNGKAYRMAGSHSDITEEVCREVALRESEERFRTLVENADDIVYSVDADGKILYASPNWHDYFGGETDPVGRLFETYIHPEDRELYNRNLSDIFTKKTKRCKFEYRIRHKSGIWQYQMTTGSIISDENGNPERFIGISRDMTEIKEAETHMSALSAVVENSDNIIVMKDLELKVMATNMAFVKASGHKSINELIGKTDAEIFNIPKNKEPVKSYMQDELKAQHLSRGHYISREEPVLYPDGTVHFVLTKKYPIYDKDDRLIGTGNISTDITKQKEIEKRLDENRRILQSIIDTIPGTLNVIDDDYNVVAMNNADFRLKLTDFETADQVIGNKCYEVFMKSSKPCDWCKIHNVFETGESFFETTTPDDPREINTGKALTISLSPIKNKDGKVEHVVEYGFDVTELRNAKLAAQEASKVKSEFLANMSHEIRTPLNGVIGFTDLLGHTKLSHVQKDYVDNANQSAHTLLDLINDILDFSKIEAGKLEIERIRFDLIELIENASDILKYEVAEKGLEFLLDVSPDIPRFVIGDPVRLKQILVNLLSNAVKFTEKGEVELSLSFKKIKDGLGEFEFSVCDTGIGISEADRHKLFKAFSQADTSVTRRFGGTGLGLVISTKLLKKMGSDIRLESREGEGSTFSFVIKTVYDYGENNDNEKMLENNKKIDVNNILIIDDNYNNRKILQDMLGYWGIKTDSADSGKKGIELLSKNKSKYEAIIIDYAMPDMNGIETVKRIRNDIKLEDDPVILLHSSSEDLIIHKQCKELKINFNLTKPVKFRELKKTLDNIHYVKEHTICDNDNFALTGKKDNLLNKNFRVLVAEDVEMNYLLVKKVFERLYGNFEIFHAVDGSEAVDIFKEKKPHIIMMDIQMPVLDGYEATKKIRSLENTYDEYQDNPLTIIALTANAYKREKDKCLDSGMDYYIAKPIDVKIFKEIIDTVIFKMSESLNLTESKGDELLHFDHNVLLSMLDNDEIFLKTLIDGANKNFIEYYEGLESAVLENDNEEIKIIAHKINGLSKNLRCNALTELTTLLQENLDRDKNFKLSTLKQIKEEIDIVLELFRKV